VKKTLLASAITLSVFGLTTNLSYAEENKVQSTPVETTHSETSTDKVEKDSLPAKEAEPSTEANANQTTNPAKKEEAPVAVATPLPTKTAEYTADDLQRIAAAWIAKDIENNRKTMKDLLGKFGVKAITVLPQESYGAFVQELKNLGVDI